MYIVQSLEAALTLIILGRTIADARDDVISFAHFLAVLEEDTAALSFPSAEIRIDVDVNLIHNKLARFLISTNTTR